MKPLFDFDGNGNTDALELLLATGALDTGHSDFDFDDESESDDTEDDYDLFDDDEDDEL